MNRHLKIGLYFVLFLHLGAIALELYVCINNLSGYKFTNTFLQKIVSPLKEILFTRCVIQLVLAIYRIIQVLMFFFMVYISINLKYLNIDTKHKDFSVHNSSIDQSEEYANRERNLKIGQSKNQYNNREDKEKNYGTHVTHAASESCLTSKIISFFGTEKRVLVFLSYFYWLSGFLFNSHSSSNILFFLIAPFIFYKINLKLYEKYKTKKCFLFNISYFLVFYIVQIMYISLNCNAKPIDSSVLPKRIQEWFIRENKNLIVQKIESNVVNVEVTDLGFVVFIRITGNWDLLTEEQKISILYHEIGHIENNSSLCRLLIVIFNIILLTFLEYYLLRFSSYFVSNKLTKEGSYFVIFILISITVAPLSTILTNIFFHYDEMNADEFSIKNYDKIHLAGALTKMTLISGLPFENSYVYEIFYFSHPSLARRLKNIGVGNK